MLCQLGPNLLHKTSAFVQNLEIMKSFLIFFIDVNFLQKDLKKKMLLDRCEVRVDGKMDAATEKLTLPTDLLVQYLLDTKEFNEGFEITGE